jgi:triacylglycerol lipase
MSRSRQRASGAPPRHAVYLIPGFFGFANVGRLRYFLHVRQFLVERFAAHGLPAEVHAVQTYPTASLPRRAVRLAEAVMDTASTHSAIHLIGHSSGGLDARLLVAPAVVLPTAVDIERWATRVRTVISISTPHYGSPVAAFLASRRGQKLLELLSVSTTYVLRFGSLPLAVLLALAAIVTAADNLGTAPTLLDELFQQLLADFSVGRRRAVQRLLREVAADQALLTQLTPESMDVFNAAVRNRPGVRYGCVVARATRPGVRSTLRTGLDAAAQANHAVYQAIYRLAAQTPRSRAPVIDAAAAPILRHAFRGLPTLKANDGIVPTRAQVWGDVIAAVQADHLDVIGHFADPDQIPPHFDWLSTGSGFDRAQFEALWAQIFEYIVRRH